MKENKENVIKRWQHLEININIMNVYKKNDKPKKLKKVNIIFLFLDSVPVFFSIIIITFFY